METNKSTGEVKPVEPLKLVGMKVDVRPSDTKEGQMINVEKALKILKKKLEKDGVLMDYKERRYYKKQSVINREHAKKVRKNRR